jgi:hypothetical protein
MANEKMDKPEERDEHIVVLDEGIHVESMADPRGICCRGPMFAFRG